jgi:hypothetical protein
MHSDPQPASPVASRLKLADLTSGIGAIVLGVGLGTVAGHYLEGLWAPLVLGGILLHGWGMYDKHRLESGQPHQPRWATALYWICWALLAALLALIVLRLVRSS